MSKPTGDKSNDGIISNDQDRNKQYHKLEDGPEGVDKAPGEEPAKGNEDLMKQAQKGKKVDADPSLESDKPAQ